MINKNVVRIKYDDPGENSSTVKIICHYSYRKKKYLTIAMMTVVTTMGRVKIWSFSTSIPNISVSIYKSVLGT